MYSREEILALSAGRELDALVAEHVMGYTIVPPNTTLWKENAPYPFIIHDEEWGYRLYEEPAEDGWPFSQFNPSTDIAAAWEVVEKFPIFEVRRIEVFEGNITYEAEVWADLEEGVEPIEFTAKSAPEVICKAALLSLLKED